MEQLEVSAIGCADVGDDDGMFDSMGEDGAAALDEELISVGYTDISPDKDDPTLTFEEQVEKVRACVYNQPAHREILYRTLVFCETRRGFSEVEDEIACYPEFGYAQQNQYRLITYLVDAGGLEKLELNVGGQEITPQMKEGLSEDEADDLVASYALITTLAGKAVADEMDPTQRIGNLLDFLPERRGVYAKLLDYLKEGAHTYEDIDALLDTAELKNFKSLNTVTDQPIKPSVFIDKMERAGGIVYHDGWHITSEGRKYLETLQSASK